MYTLLNVVQELKTYFLSAGMFKKIMYSPAQNSISGMGRGLSYTCHSNMGSEPHTAPYSLVTVTWNPFHDCKTAEL
jgi:hypothetical protein